MSDLAVSPPVVGPGESPGPKHVTFINAVGKAIAHFTGPTQASCAENTPPGCTCVDGHQPLDHAPGPSEAEKESDKAKHMIKILEEQQARALREERIGRGGTNQELKTRLEAIDDRIIQLRTKII